MAGEKRVIVIGAGAAGFMAAITAAQAGAKVTILEHMNTTARKIELTGNGKCNFTNENQDISCYNTVNGKDKQLILKVITEFSSDRVIDFFENLGIVCKSKNGYCYPMSEQATAISAVLRMKAEQLKIKIACNINIDKITKEKDVFFIKTKGYTYEAEALIIAAGSKCYSSTGSNGSGYKLAEEFGHEVIGPFPALVQLQSSDKEIASLAGLRIPAKAVILIDDIEIADETGEIQFIKNGISGIPIFQLSRYASISLNTFPNKKVQISIDLMPNMNFEKLISFMNERKKNNEYKNLSGFLTGMFNEKMLAVICRKMNIKGNVKISEFSDEEILKLCKIIKSMRFNINKTGGFELAQICCGGISLQQLNEKLESKLVKNLYFAGEILDVDGKCGGYNLQWAWSSGFVSGKYSAE